MDKQFRSEIEEILHYHFSDPGLLEKAFMHSSSVDNRKLSNERQEFLGDSVLGMVICQKLFEKFPSYLEGELTKMKSSLVSRRMCADIASEMGLIDFISVGKGMKKSSSINGSVAAGLLEAVICAIYLDGGFEAAQEFILRIFRDYLENADDDMLINNCKSILQQHAQKSMDTTPHYNLLDEKGPDHDKCFEVQVSIKGRQFKSGWGKTKKQAEQKAARNALRELNIIKSDNPKE
jgi:ribonuclease-3